MYPHKSFSAVYGTDPSVNLETAQTGGRWWTSVVMYSPTEVLSNTEESTTAASTTEELKFYFLNKKGRSIRGAQCESASVDATTNSNRT